MIRIDTARPQLAPSHGVTLSTEHSAGWRPFIPKSRSIRQSTRPLLPKSGGRDHPRERVADRLASRRWQDRCAQIGPAWKEAPVPSIGDRVRFESTKVGQVPRDGVVIGVEGQLLHIEWSTGGESSLVPGAGSITIVGNISGKTSAKRTIKKRTPARKAAKREEVDSSEEADPSPKGRQEGCEEVDSSEEADPSPKGRQEGCEEVDSSEEADPSPKGRQEGCEEVDSSPKASRQEGV